MSVPLKRIAEKVASYKITLIGLGRTGKTSICEQYVHKKFEEEMHSTIGATLSFPIIEIEAAESSKQSVKLLLWDLAGTQKYDSTPHVINSNAMLLMLDGEALVKILDDQTALNKYLDEQYEYFKKFKQYIGQNTLIYVVINKLDLICLDKADEEAKKTQAFLKQFVEKWFSNKKQQKDGDNRIQGEVFFTSAKSNTGIGELFTFIAQKCFLLFPPPIVQHVAASFRLQKKIEDYYNQLPKSFDETQKAMMLLKDMYLEGNSWGIDIKKFFLGIFNPTKRKHIEQVQQMLSEYISGKNLSVKDILKQLTGNTFKQTKDKYLVNIITYISYRNPNCTALSPENPKKESSNKIEIQDLDQTAVVATNDSEKNSQPTAVTVNNIINELKNLPVHGLGGQGSIHAPTQLLPEGAAKILDYLRHRHPDKHSHQVSVATNQADRAKQDGNLSEDEIKEITKVCRTRLFGNTKICGIFNNRNSYRDAQTTAFYAKCGRLASMQ